MIPARRLTQPARNSLLRRLSGRDGRFLSSSSQVQKTNEAWSQSEGGRPWWSSSSALPAALMAIGAGAAVSCVDTSHMEKMSVQDSLSKLSSVLSTEVATAKAEQMHQEEPEDETTDVINWSGTHQVNIANKNFFEPESVEEVEKIVKDCQERGQTVRPLGSSLSPNGVALNKDGMISMANLDKVLEIDTENRTITVQAGIPVREVRNISMNRWLFLHPLLLCRILTHPCSLLGCGSLATPQFDFTQSSVYCRTANGRFHSNWRSRDRETDCAC